MLFLSLDSMKREDKENKKRENDIKTYYWYIGRQNVLGEIIKKRMKIKLDIRLQESHQ